MTGVQVRLLVPGCPSSHGRCGLQLSSVQHWNAQGYLPIRQAPSMFLCSSFSIAAGGSLGPEAPLLALCAATTSWLGRKVLHFLTGPLASCLPSISMLADRPFLQGHIVLQRGCSNMPDKVKYAWLVLAGPGLPRGAAAELRPDRHVGRPLGLLWRRAGRC